MRDYTPDLLALSTRPSTRESRQLSALCRQLAPQHFQGLPFRGRVLQLPPRKANGLVSTYR